VFRTARRRRDGEMSIISPRDSAPILLPEHLRGNTGRKYRNAVQERTSWRLLRSDQARKTVEEIPVRELGMDLRTTRRTQSALVHETPFPRTVLFFPREKEVIISYHPLSYARKLD